MSDYVLILVSAALVNHLVLQAEPIERARLHALGLCSALMILVALPVGAWLHRQFLAPMELQNLQLFIFLPLLTALAWTLPNLLRRFRPSWPMHGLQPLLSANAVVLGLLLQLANDDADGWRVLVWAVISALGFWLALMLYADLEARCHHGEIPAALRGLPVKLIGSGVMAMALSGFNGLFTQ
ncbi:Rnf-Nqr domain containing protein [Pseudomonas mosselii]|uniref:Rnf-Nqr domain containing protein n=1 Tax=Pseudomonas mosselii TaxID=78327 RepID=UPI001BD673E5|nr:Rnf-Nqr domain containing protein [Pseudomonas mosselii]MBS9762442.1 electron transporter RnfA [Pseudomonas mosselii]